jgi:hypothetical protein
MRTIKDIIDELRNTKAIIDHEIETIPFTQRQAWQTAVITARAKLPALTQEIKSLVIPKMLVAVFADGDVGSIKTVGSFLKENEGLVIDAERMYRSVVERVEPSYSTDRTFCSTQYHLMVQRVVEIAVELGYLEIQPPEFKDQICPTEADTLNYVRELLRNCGVGDQANTDFLGKEIVDTIVAESIDAKQIPVLVTGTSCNQERNRIATLFNTSHAYTFQSDFEPNVRNVTQIFKGQTPKETKEND